MICKSRATLSSVIYLLLKQLFYRRNIFLLIMISRKDNLCCLNFIPFMPCNFPLNLLAEVKRSHTSLIVPTKSWFSFLRWEREREREKIFYISKRVVKLRIIHEKIMIGRIFDFQAEYLRGEIDRFWEFVGRSGILLWKVWKSVLLDGCISHLFWGQNEPGRWYNKIKFG